ncbi:hypothetical protein [Protaetiibacter intestinalis]|uniref:ABC transporter ATP-binding protein n=1 Tax=Protaetiibacter intestinalis TaxID=2419774 RepID=A0A387B5R9_9MICO|nr:hypothetical protein [Protaetiibacter intestinalis]AYF97753.1 hypothetical protein D7I47_05455 [Protaetiibacter intestinalis]
MRISLTGVDKGSALPPTTLSYGTGELVLAEAETAERPTVLGLIASGRMRPAHGEVRIDGADDTRRIRREIALVDAPAVSEPPPGVTLAGVAAEELMFAGRWASAKAALAILEELGAAADAGTRMADLAPATRVRVLAELALLRPGVRGLVVVSPDRHGGEPAHWQAALAELAERELAVLAVIGRPAMAALNPWSAA